VISCPGITKMSEKVISTAATTEFPPWGYAVHKLRLSDAEIKGLKKIAVQKPTQPIFNQVIASDQEGVAPKNDGLRKMSTPFTHKGIRNARCLSKLWQQMQIIGKYHNREWEPFRLVVLRSMPGCMAQESHTDGTGGLEIGGILVAVQDGTFFQVNGRDIELSAGDAVSFHGNTPHNGAAFDAANVRFHAYLAREENDVPQDAVGKFHVICDGCHRGFNSRKDMRKHKCKARKPEVKERERVLNTINKRTHRAKEKEKKRKEMEE
jgi:hypothetical protein